MRRAQLRQMTVALGTGFESLHTGRDNLRPDSISAYGGNPVSTHCRSLCLVESFSNVLTLIGRCAALGRPNQSKA